MQPEFRLEKRCVTGSRRRSSHRSCCCGEQLLHRLNSQEDRRKATDRARDITGVWRRRLEQEEDIERFRDLAEAMPPIGWLLGAYASLEPETREEAGAGVLFSFMSGMIHAVVTSELAKGMDSELSRYRTPYRRGSSPVAELWWNSLILSTSPSCNGARADRRHDSIYSYVARSWWNDDADRGSRRDGAC